jgi:integrase/recombinase XerD
MSDTPINEEEQTVAEAFDQNIDPLAAFEDTFDGLDVDPFQMWLENRIETKDLAEGTVDNYERSIEQWREHMESQGRHPACPSEAHVKGFAQWCRDRDNGGDTIRKKLININSAYQYMQSKQAFPHPMDFNPFDAARHELDLTNEDAKHPPNISLSDLRDIFGEVKNIRDRLLIGAQLKLGLRSSELCNIKISEIHIDKPDVLDHYDEMGSHPALDGVRNAVYIPFDREQNKSRRPRVLPLDDEMQKLLLDYLLIRQDNGSPWLLLTMRGNQTDRNALLYVWKNYFHPEYDGSARYRPVTPHFGRHWFTTWFRKECSWDETLVQYMRGDKHGNGILNSRNDVIYEYVHTYYDDIEDQYNSDVFKLGVL